MTKKPMPSCHRLPGVPGSQKKKFSTADAPFRTLAWSPSKPISVVSKLRTGPGTSFCEAWQVPPAVMQGSEPLVGSQVAPGVVPPSHTPGTGAPGIGYARKSGMAVGIGLLLFRLVLLVNPLKPVSSPLRVPERSGLVNGPKVRCLTAVLCGLIPSVFAKYHPESRNTSVGQPPLRRV